MKAKEYNLIAECVETGVMLGWNRAHEHSETPEPYYIHKHIQEAVLNQICEWFEFEDVKDEN